MKWLELCKIGLSYPEVVEDFSYGTPALKVREKMFARLKEDGSSVAFYLSSLEQKEELLNSKPEIYFTTDHYNGYAMVLARLSTLTKAQCKARLDESWRIKAPKTLVKAFEKGSPRDD